MKQTIILLAGIIVLGLAGLITISATTENNMHFNKVAIEQDAKLNIEDWMIEDKYWSDNSLTESDITVEQDAELKVENWMVEEKNWN